MKRKSFVLLDGACLRLCLHSLSCIVLIALALNSASYKQLIAQQIAVRPDAGEPPKPASSAIESPGSPRGGVRDTTPEDQSLGKLAMLLTERCLACHGPEKEEGSYSLRSFAQLRTPGDSARSPIVPGQPDASELFRRLVTTDESERMPAEAARLADDELKLVRDWIASGAALDPAQQQRPMASLATRKRSAVTPHHYPAPLPIAAVAMLPGGQSAVVSGYGEVIQWQFEPVAIKQRRQVAGTQVTDIEVSADGRLLAVASGTPGTQGFVEVWSLTNGQAAASATVSPGALWSDTSADTASDIAFSPDASRLAIGRNDGTLQIVDLRGAMAGASSTSQLLAPHADAILAVAWSAQGNRLITGSRDRTAKIFDAQAVDLIANYDRHQRAVGGVAYCGDFPVSFDETGTLRLWSGDDNDRTLTERDNLTRFLERLAVDDKRIVLAAGSQLRRFSVERKTVDDGKDDEGKPKTKKTTRWVEEEQFSSDSSGWILSMSISSDRIVAGNELGEVIVWHHDQPKPVIKFLAQP